MKLGPLPLESTLESHLLKAVLRLGGITIKLPALWYIGIPDRLLLLPGARVYFLELKREGKHPTDIQQWWIERLQALGFDAQFVSGRAALDKYIAALDCLSL